MDRTFPPNFRPATRQPGEGGLSPYQILFVRERPLASVPYTPHIDCEESREFFERMKSIDKKLLKYSTINTKGGKKNLIREGRKLPLLKKVTGYGTYAHPIREIN